MKIKINSIIKSLWNEFVYGGHLFSLGCSSGFIISIVLILDIDFSLQPIIVLYLISQIAYTYNHFKEMKNDILTNPERVKHLQKRVLYFPIIINLYIFLLIIFSIFVSWYFLIYVLFLLILGALYTKLFKKLTYKILCFKNIYISFSWLLGISIVFFYYNISFNYFFLLFFFFIFIRMMLNTIFFDIKDIEDDKKNNLKTLPVVMGKDKSLMILNIINLISFIPIIFGVFLGIMPSYILILFISYFYALYYLKRANTTSLWKIRKISYIMVDGEFFFWPILLILINFII